MHSCWDADPCKRPSFGKIVENIEQQISESTKHVCLHLSSLALKIYGWATDMMLFFFYLLRKKNIKNAIHTYSHLKHD